jgi:hypothetical protein
MRKPAALSLSTIIVSLVSCLVLVQHARADESEFDIDPKFRAKIAKEKVKQAAIQRNTLKDGSSNDSQCGSQSIGNVNTGGRIGAAPREVFVFAPNAINLVSGQGCK